MGRSWQQPVTAFALFNLIAVPLVGRGVWAAMLWLNAGQAVLVAVLLSVVAAFGILGVNAALTVRAARAGLPQAGRTTLWLVTGVTFALTIGTGMFSPLTLLHALIVG